jgi:hypothetical protein
MYVGKNRQKLHENSNASPPSIFLFSSRFWCPSVTTAGVKRAEGLKSTEVQFETGICRGYGGAWLQQEEAQQLSRSVHKIKIAYYWGVLLCRRHFRTGAALPTRAARSAMA